MDGDAVPQGMAQLQTQQLLDKINCLEQDNLSLRERVRNLNTYKSQIMAIHAADEEPTHIAMQSDYKKLRDNIQKWIEACESDEGKGEFTTRFEYNIADKTRALEGIGLCQLRQGKVDSGDMRKLVWLGQQETCNCVILTLVIWGILEREIFQGHNPVGFHHMRMDHLRATYREMIRQCDNTEGEFSSLLYSTAFRSPTANLMKLQLTLSYTVSHNRAGLWWTTAIRTVTSAEDFKDECEKATEDLLQHLTNALEVWVTARVLEKHKSLLRNGVLELAIKLKRDICCSQAELSFSRPKDVFFRSRQTKPPYESTTWELRNIGNWMTLKQEDAQGSFCCLFPGLCIQGVEEPLVEPLIAAYKKTSATMPWDTRPPSPRESAEQHKKESLERKEKEKDDSSQASRFVPAPGDGYTQIHRPCQSEPSRHSASSPSSPKKDRVAQSERGSRDKDPGCHSHEASKTRRRKSMFNTTKNTAAAMDTVPSKPIDLGRPATWEQQPRHQQQTQDPFTDLTYGSPAPGYAMQESGLKVKMSSLKRQVGMQESTIKRWEYRSESRRD